jgi:hypothetical protein
MLTATSWLPRHPLTLVEWVRQGQCLGTVSRASGWWIGDWTRYGNAKYGEKYEEAARITGYDVHTLMNMAYVASRFEISRRREKLSFSHHAELAALAPDDQERWLDRAEVGELSLRRLREELRREARLVRSSTASSTSAAAAPLPSGESNAKRRPRAAEGEVVCPECGHHFRPAERRRANGGTYIPQDSVPGIDRSANQEATDPSGLTGRDPRPAGSS